MTTTYLQCVRKAGSPKRLSKRVRPGDSHPRVSTQRRSVGAQRSLGTCIHRHLHDFSPTGTCKMHKTRASESYISHNANRMRDDKYEKIPMQIGSDSERVNPKWEHCETRKGSLCTHHSFRRAGLLKWAAKPKACAGVLAHMPACKQQQPRANVTNQNRLNNVIEISTLWAKGVAKIGVPPNGATGRHSLS